MSNFFYRVRNNKEEILHGNISARSVADAAVQLERKGYTVLEIKEEISNVKSYEKNISFSADILPLSIAEKKEFFTSFYFLYKSSLPVLEIFKSMLHSSKSKQVRFLCMQIVKKVEKGSSLKDAMKRYSEMLGIAYTTLIVAGEESGKLEDILSDIIQNINKQEEITSDLISKLTYPALIFLLAIAVGLFFQLFVLKVFAMMGSGVSQASIMTMLVAALIKIAVIYAILFGVIFVIYKNKKLLNKVVNFVLGIRLFSNLMKNYYFSNFFSVLALSYSAGVTAAESVYLANSVIHIPSINKKIKKSESMIYNGCEVTTALGVTGLFAPYAMSQVSAGEKAGELDKMFKTVAVDYQNKLETSVNILLKLVEPLTIAIVGLFVAYIASNAYKSYYASIFAMF